MNCTFQMVKIMVCKVSLKKAVTNTHSPQDTHTLRRVGVGKKKRKGRKLGKKKKKEIEEYCDEVICFSDISMV